MSTVAVAVAANTTNSTDASVTIASGSTTTPVVPKAGMPIIKPKLNPTVTIGNVKPILAQQQQQQQSVGTNMNTNTKALLGQVVGGAKSDLTNLANPELLPPPTNTPLHSNAGPAKVSPSLKQQIKPIIAPKPVIKSKAREVRICLPSITEIYGSIYTEIHKRVLETLTDVLERVSEDYKIDQNELKEKYLKDLKVLLEKNQEEVKKVSAQNPRKPRTVLAPELRCMARTANGEQCTRRKQIDNGYDFCGSHCMNQPYGKLGDAPLEVVEKRKRGRPPRAKELIAGPGGVKGGEVSGTSSNSGEGADGEIDEPESPYDLTVRMNAGSIKDGEQEYIYDQDTMIVYEMPSDEHVHPSDLTRVGMWDPANSKIEYDAF